MSGTEIPLRQMLRRDLRTAIAIVHGGTEAKTMFELVSFVLEHGIPPREERERIRDKKLKEATDG